MNHNYYILESLINFDNADFISKLTELYIDETKVTKHDDLTLKIQQITNKKFIVCIIETKRVLNAFSTGTSYLYITRPLLNSLTERQAIAVLLHEASHSITKDPIIISAIESLAKYGVKHSLLAGHFHRSYYLPAILVFGLCTFTLQYGSRLLSHAAEYKSDSYVKQNGYGEDLVQVLNICLKYEKQNKACTTTICRLSRFLDNLKNNYHPETIDRINKLMLKSNSSNEESI